MTALRPERESGAAYGGTGDDGSSYGQQPYGGPGAFEAAVEQLADPLTDPLPGQEWSAQGQHQYAADGPEGYAPDWQGVPGGAQDPAPAYGAPPTRPMPVYAEPVVAAPKLDDETVALRASEVSEARRRAEQLAGRATNEGMPAPGGRAARRKAARRHGRHGGAQEPQESPGAQESVESAEKAAEAPLSRVQARRAARAQKPGAAVLVSRLIGEVFITTGVLMLLFVTYQLWWSNVRAHQQAGSAAHHLQEDWASGKRSPGTFEPGQGFAILHIPKLDVVAPIAEGTSKSKVLDRGMVGHYGEGALKTAMPDAKTGNFGLAGHRNTHGEPFRYINRLKPGDSIVVETQDDYFVYKMTSILPVTSPSNTKVLDPIPQGSGFTAPGRYITLTTCTPEFTSKYRMIVWGKMVEERPRSKGKPDALLG
ncbi:class E sortase [Streptomyces mirabilis]|uniref:class E sortase n=1 Tax=Streptomyces mirabilis TaxID=68239 RepID=UPI0021BE70EE|nr:class E sortase [Streptomyces mirabilis]MCT9110669.1 class E sortase [Streptomyces mirabilis]